MAAVLFLGAGLLGLMTIVQRFSDYDAYQAYRAETEQETAQNPFGFTRSMNSPFSAFSSIIYSPTFQGAQTPFIRAYDAISNLGYPKTQYVTEDNTVYEVYKGTEDRLRL